MATKMIQKGESSCFNGEITKDQILQQNLTKEKLKNQKGLNFDQNTYKMKDLQQKQSFQIFVKNYQNKSLLLRVKQNDSIKSLKEKIHKKSKIPLVELKLYFRGIFLMDDKLIKDYGLSQGSTIFLTISLLGGLFTFNSIQKKIQKIFQSSGPVYRAVKCGLNLHTKCKNPSCLAYNKKIIVQKGFGNFNISKQICQCKCPVCSSRCPQATNFGYFKTQIKVQGKQKDGKIIKWSQRSQKQTYTTFQNNDQDLREWIYLQIVTNPLQYVQPELQSFSSSSDSSQDFQDFNEQTSQYR